MKSKPKTYRLLSAIRLAICAAMLLLVLCGCTKDKKVSSGSKTTDTSKTDEQNTLTEEQDVLTDTSTDEQNASTDPEPVTLEQVLLKQRGIPFDQSDYKKFLGGENIITEYAEFDCNLDHSYSGSVNDLVVADGKLYQANFNSTLANGKNIQELGTLPGRDVRYWYLTYDGEMGEVYLGDGTGYKISNPPFTISALDKEQYPLFRKVYRYASDGKTLEDHTEEYLNADKIYDFGIPMIAFTGDKVSLLFTAGCLDEDTTDWNWYRNMGWREYIAFDLDLTAIGSETPVRLFNQNILMTNCAFYEIVYATEPMDDSDQRAQLAPDGSVSPYYPAAQHLNCNLTLRKITLLSNYYSDVRNISTSHVITADYTMLPITEVITEGYSDYVKYNCKSIYWDYNQE